MSGIENTFRTALFQVIAAVTTTGFATVDYQMWGHIYWLLFLAMILFCGCEGSTSGGMKISRLVVLSKNTLLVFKKQVHPDALYRVKMNGRIITGHTSSNSQLPTLSFQQSAISGRFQRSAISNQRSAFSNQR
ncbi:MAG: hypothetical protein JJE08_00150 [Proteiniphilum sp.]|nr:hypothetical protein [Proteiniphilum sp.]